MSLSRRRIAAILTKELREYARKRSIVISMAIFPLIFLIQPAVVVFVTPASATEMLSQGHVLLYLLGIPILTPALLAAYAIAGERQTGSLEPVLTTPIRAEELLLAKGLAVLVPALLIAYVVYAIFLACVALFAQPGIASAVLRPVDIAAQLILTPLLAGPPIWIGIAISTRVEDVRVGQQLSLLASVPLAIATSLIALGIITLTAGLAVGLTIVLVTVDVVGWRIVSRLFDRERLIAGSN